MERVAHACTSFRSNFILTFQNLFRIIPGPHGSSGRNSIVKHIQCFPQASPGESHIHIVASYLHMESPQLWLAAAKR